MKISVWYHCRLFGGIPPIDPDYSITLMSEQMDTMKRCGLESAADSIHVCVNGNSENTVAARMIAPAKATVVANGANAESLLPTCNALRKWSIGNPDKLVCFWHTKGVTHPWDELTVKWRKCMEKSVILTWRPCVTDLCGGAESVGAHWLTPEQYGAVVRHPFWGGQFFWAKSSFLAELPELPNAPKCRDDWFLSENWIGMGRRPKIVDYAPHWPALDVCGRNV